MRQVCLLFALSIMSLSGPCFSSNPKEIKEMSNPTSLNPIIVIHTTAGDIKVELNADKAPITVKNFLRYAQEGHYNGTIFHRVIDGFMVQGGGFTKDMKQKPVHAPIKIESENGLKNNRGSLAMARTSDVNSATSQFFINVVDNSFLDFSPRNPGYAVFGHVIEGMDVVDKMKKVKTQTKNSFENVPVEPIEMISLDIM